MSTTLTAVYEDRVAITEILLEETGSISMVFTGNLRTASGFVYHEMRDTQNTLYYVALTETGTLVTALDHSEM